MDVFDLYGENVLAAEGEDGGVHPGLHANQGEKSKTLIQQGK
jgi:hypothetical protein